MITRVFNRTLHGFDNMIRRWQIRVTHTKVNDIHATGHDLRFFPIYLLEQIGGKFPQPLCFFKITHVSPFCYFNPSTSCISYKPAG